MFKSLLVGLAILTGCTWNGSSDLPSEDFDDLSNQSLEVYDVPFVPSIKVYDAEFTIINPWNFCWRALMSIPFSEFQPPLDSYGLKESLSESDVFTGCGDDTRKFVIEGEMHDFIALTRVDFHMYKCYAVPTGNEVIFEIKLYLNGDLADDRKAYADECNGIKKMAVYANVP